MKPAHPPHETYDTDTDTGETQLLRTRALIYPSSLHQAIQLLEKSQCRLRIRSDRLKSAQRVRVSRMRRNHWSAHHAKTLSVIVTIAMPLTVATTIATIDIITINIPSILISSILPPNPKGPNSLLP